MGYYFGWKAYVPVAERKRKALLKIKKLKKKGLVVEPIRIEGRTIAEHFGVRLMPGYV